MWWIGRAVLETRTQRMQHTHVPIRADGQLDSRTHFIRLDIWIWMCRSEDTVPFWSVAAPDSP